MGNKIMYIAIAIAIGAGLVSVILDWKQNPVGVDDSQIACTEEAMMCPDGSYVGRTGPKCEFVCPSTPIVPTDVQAQIDSKSNLINLTNPAPLSTLQNPLILSGEARGYWFFEASFPVMLTNWDGLIIAEGPATAVGEWMTEEFVPFTANLDFVSPYSLGDPDFMKNGTLILKKDNPSGLPENDDALEIPVRFAP